MLLRVVLATLWFISIWMTYGLVAYFLGLPDSGGAVVGALLAAFVFMDPPGQLWAHAGRAAPVSTPARASDLSDSATASAR